MAIDPEKLDSKQDSGKEDQSAGKEKKPEGGHDNTPLRPSSEPTYTVKITFHSASNLPVSDLGARSSDPFVLAQLNTGRPPRNPQDPYLRFRSHTVQQTLEPEWSSEWIVAGVPASGFQLKVRVMDEDPGDHDDQVGKVTVESGRLEESWKGINKQEFKMRKAGADLKSYALRWIRASMCKNVQLHARIVISVEVLGKTKEEIGKAYTVNNFWWIHYSPMIGRLTGTKSNDAQGVEKFNFQANELQLRGPVPSELYHRYVEFKPFIKGMFKNAGLRGRILHKALHHQHERLYNFDKMTKFGTLPDGPGDEMTLQFLEMAHFDQGGRIFTYVITLDGMFRFTETGKEFGIDMLSKHTMHSDVNIFIAWSGEFLIRRLSKPDKNANAPDQHTHPADDVPGGPPNDAPPQDPAHYELVIDNDSGTYRPDGQYLPVLKKFLKMNFPGLHIVTMDCTDKKLDKIKEEQKQVKDKEGDHRVFGQGPSSISSSLSSSDEEDLEERARGDKEYESTKTKGLDAVADPAGAIRGVFGSKGKVEREERETEDDQAVEQSEERAK